MHLYWRVFEELKLLKENWTIVNPNVLRCYRDWLRRHADAIALITADETAEGSILSYYKGVPQSLN